MGNSVMIDLPQPKIETYKIDGKTVYVVRDDATNPFPLPNNSKIRGIVKKLVCLREQGVRRVASQDTSISRIGWGVSAIAKELDMEHYNFYSEKKTVNFYQQMSRAHGGQIIPIHGTFASAFRELSKRWMVKNHIDAYFLPVGVSMNEGIEANSQLLVELQKEKAIFQEGSLISCVSSGTITAGLYHGLLNIDRPSTLFGVTSSSFKNRKQKVLNKVFNYDRSTYTDHLYNDMCFPNFHIVDQGYKYKDRELSVIPPFPCDLYLDRKAWKWLVDNIEGLPEPIVFWNIGGEWSPEFGLVGDLRGDGSVTPDQISKFLGEN